MDVKKSQNDLNEITERLSKKLDLCSYLDITEKLLDKSEVNSDI